MKLLLKIFFSYFLSAGLVFAYCDFDNFKIGSADSKVSSYSESDSRYIFEKIVAADICSDSGFHSIRFKGEYIDGELMAVNFAEFNPEIDHLENIIYYYGQPTNKNSETGDKSMSYFHWDLSFKQIFLKNINDGGNMRVDVHIIADNFLEKLNEIKE